MNPSRTHFQTLEAFARQALKRYGLAEKGWMFRWDRARRRFGSCNYAKRQITLSLHLARLNDLAPCQDTILHEVAHALAGREAGHGPKWKEACRRVGATPARCYSSDDVVQPESRYVRYCAACGRATPVYRRTRARHACAPCCKKHNNGKYTECFALQLMERWVYEKMTGSAKPGE